MAVLLSPVGGVGWQFFDNSGAPLTGGKLYSYAAGTTTPQNTYISASAGAAHSNPIILDSAGRVPGGEIWLTDGSSYKFVLKTSTDTTIATYDNIVGINSNFVNYTSEQEVQTATAGQTVFTLTTLEYQPGTNSLSVFVNGLNFISGIDFTETSSTTVTFATGLTVGDEVRFTASAINAASYGDASQISYTPAGTGAVATNVQTKLRESVSVKDFGAVGDGVTDDTAAIQAAVNYAQTYGKTIYFPTGKYRTTSTISVTSGVSFYGDMPKAKNAGGADFFGGSWLYFDHTGRGITAINSSGFFTDVVIKSIGTYRNQPAPGVGWTPTANDFDLYCYGVYDVSVHDVLMLNPTKGVGFFGTSTDSSARLDIKNFRAQAFQVGIQIDTSYDVARLDHIHFWPFWRDNTYIHNYTMSNLDAVYSLRNDNPMMSNLFTIFARSGLRIGQNTNGGTSKLHLVNADFDRGVYGVWVDSTVTTGITAQFDNITHQGETGISGSKAVFVQGNSSKIDFGNINSQYSMQNGIRVDGSGNIIRLGTLTINNYNQVGTAFPALEVASGNTAYVSMQPQISGGGSGPYYGGAGSIYAPDYWIEYTPTVTSETGTITTLGAASCSYQVAGDRVTVAYDITITTAGTGAGGLRFTLPFSCTSSGLVQRFSGYGREIIVSGKSHTTTMNPGVSIAEIRDYGNATVIANNARVIGSISYRK